MGRAFVPSLMLVGLVVSIISSLGAPLIPALAREFGTELGAAQWSLTATMLVGAVASPLVGRLGDGPHRRAVLVVCLSGVVLGGALASLAGNIGVLIVGRALQGLGLAVMPLTMAAAREFLPRERATTVIATLSVIGAVGIGLGYPITGLVADAELSAAFWLGTAASAVALVAAVRYVPPSRTAATGDPLDVPGAALIAAGLLGFLVALEKAPEWGWGSGRTLGLLLGGLLLLAIWVVHELRNDAPLVDLRLLRHRAVLTANVSALLLGVTMYLSLTLVTQIVQHPDGADETVFVAGLTLVPMSALSALSSGAVPALQRRFGVRATIPLGCGAVSVAALVAAAGGDRLWPAFVVMAIMGVGLGLTFAAMPALIVGAVPARETSSAMSVYQVARYVGFAVGSGLAVTLLRAFGDHGEPTVDAYGSTFLVASALTLVVAALAWWLPGRTLPTRSPVPEETAAGTATPDVPA
ncbi:MAG: MFS transporter [Solirubrobacteraceae bacterium]